MRLSSLQDLLHDSLKDLHSAETQLTKALPKMAKKAGSDDLRQAIEGHLEETEGQLSRLEQIGDVLGVKLTGKRCKAMEGLLEEGKEVLDADGDAAVLDAAMIAAAQRVEHYEISAYGSARAVAECLGMNDVAELLQQSLDEESAANEKLTAISEQEILPEASGGEETGDAENGGTENEPKSSDGSRRKNSRARTR
jgi:ferritin-like metal-binding protein YciE